MGLLQGIMETAHITSATLDTPACYPNTTYHFLRNDASLVRKIRLTRQRIVPVSKWLKFLKRPIRAEGEGTTKNTRAGLVTEIFFELAKQKSSNQTF
jgi:hypothetical protein